MNATPTFADLPPLIREYVFGFWRRRWLILGVAWLVALVGWSVVFTMPNQYEASARVFVDDTSILDDVLRGTVAERDVGQIVNNKLRALLRRSNVEQVILNADLEYDDSEVARDSLIRNLQQSLKIRKEGGGFITFSYQSTNALKAQRVVTELVNLFVEENLDSTQRDTEGTISFLSRRIEDYENQIEDKEKELAEFRRLYSDELEGFERNQRVLEGSEGITNRLEQQLDSAIWSRNQLQRRLAETQEFTLSDAAEETIERLTQSLEQLTIVYTDEHPDVMAIKRQIEQWERRRDKIANDGKEKNPVYDQLKLALEQADRVINELEYRIEQEAEKFERISLALSKTPEAQAQINRLLRDYEVLQKNHASLVDRRGTAILTEKVDAESDKVEYRIIEPPFVPASPSGPARGMLSLVVLVGALGAGGAVAFLLMQIDGTFFSIEQLSEAFAMPVLGAVSIVKSAAARRTGIMETSAFVGGVGALLMSWGVLYYLFEVNTALLGWDRLPLDLG
ncbi:MAG: XrtA system polysaccharide chain length determinant [Pseudomonadota bacterium]